MVDEFPDVKFYTYDVEETPDIAQELGVSVMPTFSLFRDGDSKFFFEPFSHAVEETEEKRLEGMASSDCSVVQEGVRGARPAELRKVIGKYVEEGKGNGS